MAIDISIFIDNKEDILQKTLAIIEISKDEKQIKYFLSRYNIDESVYNNAKILCEKLNNCEMSFKDYERLSMSNYKKFVS